MIRRKFLGYLAFGATSPIASRASKWNAWTINYQMTPMRRNVGIFTERGGTIGWLLTEDHSVVVDTQFPDQAKNLINEFAKQNMKAVDLVINTHHHGDHSGGNIAFKGIVNRIVAHVNSKINQEISAKQRDNEVNQLYPTETFTDNWQSKVGDELISLHYYGAGHTNGDAIVHFEEANIAHLGDLIFNRRFPYIDKSAGAEIQNWINILSKVNDYFDRDTLFIFGHAAEGYDVTGNHEDVQAFSDYLSRLLEFVKSSIRAGKPKEDLLKIEVIPGAEEWQGNGIQRSIEAAWMELQG